MDTARGFIAMPRSIFSDPMFADEPFTEREALLSLVADAAWRPHCKRLKRGSVNLQRGQLLASSRYLAEKWHWPEPRVRRFLNRISGRRANDANALAASDAKFDAYIDAQPTADGTIITIRDYDRFQGAPRSEWKHSDAQKGAFGDTTDDASPVHESTQREEEINNNTLLKESESARGTRIPNGFALDRETYEWAIKKSGGDIEMIDTSLRRFCDYYRQVSGRHSVSRDWQAAFRLWFDKDVRSRDQGKPANAGVAATERILDSEWEDILQTYLKYKRWTRYVTRYGPDPTSSFCRVPHHLLERYQLHRTSRTTAPKPPMLETSSR